MTALMMTRMVAFSRIESSENEKSQTPADTRTDRRREYLTQMIGSEGCTGAYGAQALMGLYPKDF